MTEVIDKTALSYWFPKLEAAGIPVPKTILLDMPLAAQQSIWAALEGNDGTEIETASLKTFLARVATAVREVGTPAFLRTDHTSAKHSWKSTCYLDSADEKTVGAHVFAIAEFSEVCDMIGLPWSRWAVREYLPIIPLAICPKYEGMPVCREFRFFVADGHVKCWHFYWPDNAIEQGGASLQELASLCLSLEPDDAVRSLAARVARFIEGAWSIDILETKRGWYVTDLAEAHKSFHWEGCPMAEQFGEHGI